MQRQLKRNAVLGVFLLVVVLYLITFSDFLISQKARSSPGGEPVWDRLSWKSWSGSDAESWVDQGGYLPLNVSYQVLAGTPAAQQKFITVGLASIKRNKGSYLLHTLRSLFSRSSPEERSDMTVVVLLADFDEAWRESTVGEIRASFHGELEQGQLVVIHVPLKFYPPLRGLKRNYDDAPERVTFRSKQNLDYAYLIHYSSGLGLYYLQVEDDVVCAQNFLTSIRKHIQEQYGKSLTWATLEFSALGYIGKLYKSVHLPLLARFLFLFYQEMPCDWLLAHFRELLTQKERILLKPSLFQHVGSFSSFQGTYNKLRDKDFEEGAYFNPPADVYSDLSVYADHIPRLAWESGEGFFWGRSPQSGNYLTVVFRAPAVVTGVKVASGKEGKDLVEAAAVELGQGIQTTEKGEKSCKEFRSLGPVENGGFKAENMQDELGSPSSCLRIRFTARQRDWVVISKIRITTKS